MSLTQNNSYENESSSAVLNSITIEGSLDYKHT